MMRRASRNNRRRLETAIKNMTARVEMAHEITDSLRLGFENMRASMARSDEKRRRREAKRSAKTGAPVQGQERALSYIDEVRGGKPADRPAGGAPQAPAPKGDDTRGIDDIL